VNHADIIISSDTILAANNIIRTTIAHCIFADTIIATYTKIAADTIIINYNFIDY
jgi:hypothetical protein